MTDERQQGAEEADPAPVDAGPVAFGEMLRLYERLAVHSSEVRGDAERTLDRAASLRAARDPRAGIAVSACRDALGAYREAVDGSLRQACEAPRRQEAAEWVGSREQVGSPEPVHTADWVDTAEWVDSPEWTPSGPVPSTLTVIRHKTARVLAVAAVAGVLGLVGWGGLPSWSTVTATSSGQLVDAPSASLTTAGSPEPSAGVAPRAGAARHAGVVGLSDDDRPAPQSRDVRRLLASTLRGTGAAPESPATVARALRAVGEVAAAVASADEALTPADDGSHQERGPTGSALSDPTDALGEAVDAARDGLPDDGEPGGEDLPDPRPSDQVDDVDGLEPVTDESPKLVQGAASDGDDRSTGSSAAGVSDHPELGH